MKNLFISILAVAALSACGGRLDETGTGVDEDDSFNSDMQAQELGGPQRTRDPRELRREPFQLSAEAQAQVGQSASVKRHRDRPLPQSEIVGVTPVLELDFSNGRLEAKLRVPEFERDHLYSVEHQGGRCGCQ